MNSRSLRLAGWPVALLMLTAGSAGAQPQRVEGGTITYHIEHRFKTYDAVLPASAATLDLDWGDGELGGLRFTATIPLGGFDSGNQLRDEHAAEALEEFLFPEASWSVDKVEVVRVEPQQGDWTQATLLVSGPLTLHGVTEVLSVEVAAVRQGDSVSLRGSFPLSLEAFGLVRPGMLGFKIKDTVTVTVELEVPAA
jgi:polyisoprenoid-binding protein YceI